VDFFEFGAKAEEFVDAHVGVEGDVFGHVADAFADFEGVGDDVVAGDADFAVGGGKISGEDLHGGAFAGAVGAEETDDLALVDMEADVLDGAETGVGLGEVIDFDHKRDCGDLKWKRHISRKYGLPQVSRISQPAACFLTHF